VRVPDQLRRLSHRRVVGVAGHAEHERAAVFGALLSASALMLLSLGLAVSRPDSAFESVN
jgi:hypothetical protein